MRKQAIDKTWRAGLVLFLKLAAHSPFWLLIRSWFSKDEVELSHFLCYCFHQHSAFVLFNGLLSHRLFIQTCNWKIVNFPQLSALFPWLLISLHHLSTPHLYSARLAASQTVLCNKFIAFIQARISLSKRWKGSDDVFTMFSIRFMWI